MRVNGKNLGLAHKAAVTKKRSRRMHSKSIRRSTKRYIQSVRYR